MTTTFRWATNLGMVSHTVKNDRVEELAEALELLGFEDATMKRNGDDD